MDYSQGAPQESLAVPLQRQKEPCKALCSQGFHLYFLWRNFLCWQLNCHKRGASPSQRQAFSLSCTSRVFDSREGNTSAAVKWENNFQKTLWSVKPYGCFRWHWSPDTLNLAHIRRGRLSLLVEGRGWLHWAKLLFWFSCGSFTVL